MLGREELLSRQRALGQFGEFILDHEDLPAILQEGCRLIAEALGVDLAKIIEIDAKDNSGLVCAGVGWKPGVVGKARIDLSGKTSEAFALESTQPVVTQDIAREDRFDFPDFLLDHGVVALVNVPILLPGRKPYGLLQVDAREPREFDDEDISFLRTYAMTLSPVIDRLNTFKELERSNERLRQVMENALGYAIVLTDADDIITDWLAGAENIFGWSQQEVVGKSASLLFTPEDLEGRVNVSELEVARELGASPNVRWHMRQDGTQVFIDGQNIVLREPDGAVRGYMKIGQDVTDRKRGEERQSTLLAELQHRVRNVLAAVQSLVQRTVSGEQPIAQIREQLVGRLDALARTQTLLTRALGIGVDLEGIIRDELDGQAAHPDQFTITGGRIELAPKAAEVVTLAVHELATNAAKYGALRHEGAHLEIGWLLDEERDPHWLRLHWREHGVPVSISEERRSGFGTELITRRVPYELRGEGRMDFAGHGIDAAIAFPLEARSSILETNPPA